MPLAPLNIPPGVVKAATPLQIKGRWFDANLIRWQAGKLMPIGGWERITSTPLSSTVRGLFTWTTPTNIPLAAIGLSGGLYALEGATYDDITPSNFVGETTGLSGAYGASDYGDLYYGLDDPVYTISTAVRSSNTVTITTSANHQFQTGTSVVIAGVTDSAFNGTFTITRTGNTTFTYSQTAANASSSGGTASLNPADVRPASSAFIPSFSWTFDNWGGDILAVASSDGRLLHYEEGEATAHEAGIVSIVSAARVSNVITFTTDGHHGYGVGDTVIITGNTQGTFNDTFTVATVPTSDTFTVSDSGTDTTGTGGTAEIDPPVPVNNRAVIVTPERHAVLIGAGGNNRRVAWSSREDYTDWNFASTTNTAGYLDLDTSSQLVMCAPVREGTLIWTQDEAWLMRYIGLPYVYGIDRIGFGCGLRAPKAFVTYAGRCVWMGEESFWVYDGGVVKPLACDVGSFVFEGIDPDYGKRYTHGSENNIFPEAWFWYPSVGSSVPDRYVVYNYAEGWWSVGEMTRTAAYGAGVLPYPIAADENNDLFYQESGWTAAGVPIETDRYAETGSINLQNGGLITFVRQAMTDSGYGYDSTQLTFLSSFTPEGAETTSGPYNPRSDGYTDVRVTGRDYRIKVAATQDAPWSIGEMRIDFTARGGR
jgi:hypothetical protein